MRMKRLLAAALSTIATAGTASAQTDPVADFYRDKVVRFVVAAGPGGMYGIYGQLLTQHWSRHIPGKPTFIMDYKPGAGGILAGNYMYNVAPKDGSYVGMLLKDLPVAQVIEPDAAKFDMSKMQWIGNVSDVPNVIAVYHKAPVTTLEGAKTTELAMGSTGAHDPEMSLNLLLLNSILGTKFKIVPGYKGAPDIDKAIEIGEVHGRGGSLQSWMTLRPDWIKENRLHFLAQIGLKPARYVPPGVPMIFDLGRTAEEKEILRFMSTPTEFGRSIHVPPGVPAHIVAALRRAFDATMSDPEFLADAKARNLDVNPTTGEELQRLITNIVQTPPATIERIRKMLGRG